MTLYVTGDDAADQLILAEPLALLIAMLLDQQVPLSWAFKGPQTIAQRLQGDLSVDRICSLDTEEFVQLCCEKPAIHRFPAVMARRIAAMCRTVRDDYDGDAARIWTEARDGADLKHRLMQIDGFGDEKSKITIALLGKRLGVQLDGWEIAARPFGDDQPRSVADAADRKSYEQVRRWKLAMRQAKKSKQDVPDDPMR